MSRTALLAAAAAALAVGGCSKTVDAGSVEDRISDSLAKQYSQKPEVKCPDDKKAKKGTTFECDGNLRGQKFKVEVTLVGDTKFTFKIKQ
jgi:hypothetical protein